MFVFADVNHLIIQKAIIFKQLLNSSTMLNINEFTILLTLYERGKAGRYFLKKIIGLGEGVIRKIINDLRSRNLVNVSKSGTELTQNGINLIQEILNILGIKNFCRIENVEKLLNIKTEVICYLYHIDKKLNFIKSIVDIRDEGIRQGLLGVLIIEKSSTGFKLSGTEIMLENYSKELCEKLEKLKNLEINDKIIIVCGLNMISIVKGFMYMLCKGFDIDCEKILKIE